MFPTPSTGAPQGTTPPTWRESILDLLPATSVARNALSRAKLNAFGEKYYESEAQYMNQRRLCQWASRNLDHASSVTNALLDYIYGEGWLPRFDHPDGLEQARWRDWLARFDEENRMSLRWQAILRECIVVGEVFLRLMPGEEVPALRLIPPEYIVTPRGEASLRRLTGWLPTAHGQMPVPASSLPSIVYGMTFDEMDHERVALYWYDDGQTARTFTPDEVMQLKFVDDPFQYPRGVGFFWKVFDDLLDLHHLAATVLRSSAKRAAFLMVQGVPGEYGDAEHLGGEPLEVAPGAYILRVHQDVSVSYPMDHLDWGGIRDWYRQKLQDVAAALGVPVHTLTKNMESQNRSNTEVSEREGLRGMARHQSMLLRQAEGVYRWVMRQEARRRGWRDPFAAGRIVVSGPPLQTPSRESVVREALELFDRGILNADQVRQQLESVNR